MVSKEYAQALFDLLSHDDKRQSLDWFYVIDEIIQKEPNYPKLMQSPNVTDEVKKGLITEAFQEAPTAFVHFLYVLIDQDRFGLLPEIREAFMSLLYEEEGVMVVEAVSAQPLSSDQQQTIKQSLAKQYDKEVVLTTRVDEHLLGGLKLLFDGRELDQSVRRQLERLQQAVARKGS